MAISKKKNPAASFMSSFGAKVNKEAQKVEATVPKKAEVEVKEEKSFEPPAKQQVMEVEAVKQKAVQEPEAYVEVKEEAETMEKVIEEAIKEDAKAKEKTVSYNFHIPYKLVKRLNRVIDEMKERDEKMLKKDFIVLAVERLVSDYERKYDVE